MLRSLVVAIAVAIPAFAQTPNTNSAPATAPFVFEAGTVELGALVGRCATYLQRNIVIDPIEVQSTPAGQGNARGKGGQGADAGTGLVFELQLPVVTDRDGCEELLYSLLWSKGLTMVALDEAKGVYEVLSMHGQRARELWQRAASRTAAEVLARPRLRQWVLVAMNLKHLNATIATNALRPFFATNSQQPQLVIGNAGTSGTVLLCGPQDTVASAIVVLQAADVVQADVNMEYQTRTEQLTKQMAELAARLEQLELMRQRIAALETKVTELSTGK
ncbi:MAG: hypothetical protein MUC36_01800 [Planctomycetes bacterium]|jgi:hypothetical protein|nr:hypothetical protein [Planctomycetota bacterium]